jgi:HlyD family secretion protein
MDTRSTPFRVMKIAVKTAVLAVVVAAVVYQTMFSPVPVDGVVVGRGEVVNEVLGTGTLQARTRAVISPRITGRLTQVLVDQSDAVKCGQLLATLDDGELRQQVAMATADVEVAKASLDRVEWEIAAARSADVLARSEYERVTQMRVAGAASAGEADTVVQRRDAASAELRRGGAAKVELQRQLVKAE